MMNIFISWSGRRSRVVALELKSWLKSVLQTTTPWMSDKDIEAGEPWESAILGKLRDCKFGIVCLTPENQTEPWLNFEAGAIAKSLDDNTRVCCYLIGMQKSDITSRPLTMFQASTANSADTFRLVYTINNHIESKLDSSQLEETFKLFWPRLQECVAGAEAIDAQETRRRNANDMIEEILESVRSIRRLMADTKAPIAWPPLQRRYASGERTTLREMLMSAASQDWRREAVTQIRANEWATMTRLLGDISEKVDGKEDAIRILRALLATFELSAEEHPDSPENSDPRG